MEKVCIKIAEPIDPIGIQTSNRESDRLIIPSVIVNGTRVAEHDVGPGVPGSADHGLKSNGVDPIVGVQEVQVVASGLGHAAVAGHPGVRVLL